MEKAKKKIKWIIASVIVIIAFMLFVPITIVKFAPANAGMGLMFILFFALNPIFSIVLGIFSGRDIRIFWFVPLLNAVAFLLSMWFVFTTTEILFSIYAIIYLAVGVIAMAVTSLLKQKAK